MTGAAAEAYLVAFVIFCRIGGCLMLMPGFSSPRIPVRVRLFIAIAIALSLTPSLYAQAEAAVRDASALAVVRIIVAETLTGLLIGLLGRIFFVALETLATAIVMAIGMGNNLGAPMDENEALPSLAELLTFAATAVFFMTDSHWEVFRGLSASYAALPIKAGYGARFGLVQVSDTLATAFLLALRIASPFIIYSIIINLALAFTNKLTPQIPIYFISLPFVVGGGLLLLVFNCKQFLDLFITAFTQWLARG